VDGFRRTKRMATPKELEQALGHSKQAIARLKALHRCYPGEVTDFEESVTRLQGVIKFLADQREALLLEEARKESTLQYQWSWWLYPRERKETSVPSLVACSPTWYDYQIDAVTAACKDPRAKYNREEFHVLRLRTRSELPDVNGPLFLYYCMTPWTGDGALPSVSSPVHPSHYGDSLKVTDAVYAAHEEYKTFDKWDGPQGMEFILMETRGLLQ
jgi:hypothetical protein